MVDYIILEADDAATLVALVMVQIGGGYSVIGGVAYCYSAATGGKYIQSMGK